MESQVASYYKLPSLRFVFYADGSVIYTVYVIYYMNDIIIYICLNLFILDNNCLVNGRFSLSL